MVTIKSDRQELLKEGNILAKEGKPQKEIGNIKFMW